MAQTNVQAFSGDVEVAGTLTVSGTLTSTTGVDTVALATDATDASRPIIFSTGTTGSQPLKTDAGITYNPSTNTLSVAGGIDNVALAADATDASRPIIFSTGTTGSQSLKTDAGITYNPSTNTLSVAGGIDNVVLATDATDAARPIIFSTGTTGSQPLKTDPGITYNPSTNKLSVTGGLSTSISPGDYLTGTAYDGSTARTFAVDATDANTASKVVARDASGNFSAGTITAALTGNADTATTLETARNINGVSFNGSADITVTANTPTTLTRGDYLTGDNFNGGTGTTWAVDATDANTASKVVARDASGNFSAGTITAALTGNADTATKVYVTSRDNTNETHYPTFTTTHDDGNTDLYQDSGFTYNPSSGTLTSTTFSGALSGNASTASQVNVTSRDSEDASHYPTFTTTDADGNASLYQDAGFYYNPSTGTLTSTTFSGALSGNASTASQVNVTSRDSTDAVHYPTFTTTHDDGNTNLYQDSGFTYNPSSGTLTSTTFAGALTGNADTATTAENQSGGTVSATSGTFSGNVSFTDSGTTKRGIEGLVAANDYWFVGGGGTATDAGFMEIATGDNGTEPIYVRQYGGSPLTGTVQRTLTLLDGSGNSSFPGSVTATSGFTGNVTGNADTATQVYVTSRDSTDASHYPTFTTTDADGNTNLYQDAGFYYNPSSGTLTSTVFSGTNGTFSGDVTTGPNLYVGTNTNDETSKSIYFGGTYGDNGYDHCVIERRIWETGTEKQELLLFSGNDGENSSGPDRIRLKGAQILFDTLNNSTDRITENTKMIIRADGDVGIGTASPLHKLDVMTSAGGTGLYIRSSNYGANNEATHIRIGAGGSAADAHHAMITGGHTTNGSSYLAFSTIADVATDGYDPAERMRITNVGNVGIGTASPGYKLHVHQNLSTSGHQIMARIGGATSSYNTLVFGSKEGRPHIGGHAGDFLAWADLSLQNDVMVIQQGGNVGIGTASPQEILHVQSTGTANVVISSDYEFTDAGLFFRTPFDATSPPKCALIASGGAFSGYNGQLDICFDTTNNNGPAYRATPAKAKVTFKADGNVGIGTNNPLNMLEVRGGDGTASDTYATFGKLVQGSAGWSGIRLGTPYASAHDAYCSVIESYNDHSANYNSELRFKTSSGNNAEAGERMRITSQGYVGIGVASPLSTFQIGTNTGAVYNNNPLNDNTVSIFGKGIAPTLAANSDMNATLFLSTNDAFAENKGSSIALAARHFDFGGGNQHLTCARISGVASGGFSGDFVVETQSGGSLYERMRILPNGNVGIGTASPGTLLSLYKNSVNGAAIQLESSGGYVSTISQKSYSSADRSLQFTNFPYAGANPAYKFLTWNSTDNGWNEPLNITGDGNVGIGTASPVAKLEVRYAEGTYGDIAYTDTSTWHNTGIGINGGSGGFIYGFDINHSVWMRRTPKSTGSDSNGYISPTIHQFYTGGLVGTGTLLERFAVFNSGAAVYGNLTVSGSYPGSSDDRIKYNEEDVTDALTLISHLKPQKYEKITSIQEKEGTWIPTDEEWETVKSDYTYINEFGFIAQDVREIPELAFLVEGEETRTDTKFVSLEEYSNLTTEEQNTYSTPTYTYVSVEDPISTEEYSNLLPEEQNGYYQLPDESMYEKRAIDASTYSNLTSEVQQTYTQTLNGYTKQIETETPLTLNYQGLFVVAIGAIQELKAKNDALETQLASVLTRLDALENT